MSRLDSSALTSAITAMHVLATPLEPGGIGRTSADRVLIAGAARLHRVRIAPVGVESFHRG